MTQEIPDGFRARIVEHNRQAALAAAMSLISAALAWLLAYGIYGMVVMLARTAAAGVDATYPWWFNPLAVALAMVSLVWASLDGAMRRYKAPPDRPVIGFHNVADVVLLPARLTFAVWEHWGARMKFRPQEIETGWWLLQEIVEQQKLPTRKLPAFVPDDALRERLLVMLQYTGWIDLHRSDEDWYYRLRSDQEADFREMTPERDNVLPA